MSEIPESVENRKYKILQAAIDKVAAPGFWDEIDVELEKKLRTALRYIFEEGVQFGSKITMEIVAREIRNQKCEDK